jgi:hypothetical protein
MAATGGEPEPGHQNSLAGRAQPLEDPSFGSAYSVVVRGLLGRRRLPGVTKLTRSGCELHRRPRGRSRYDHDSPRVCALVLAGSMIPITLSAHRFWTAKDPAVRKQQQVQFHKNMAMIGGLLFAALA